MGVIKQLQFINELIMRRRMRMMRRKEEEEDEEDDSDGERRPLMESKIERGRGISLERG